jgi:hypothetical protein
MMDSNFKDPAGEVCHSSVAIGPLDDPALVHETMKSVEHSDYAVKSRGTCASRCGLQLPLSTVPEQRLNYDCCIFATKRLGNCSY